jgi:hypothetical protein
MQFRPFLFCSDKQAMNGFCQLRLEQRKTVLSNNFLSAASARIEAILEDVVLNIMNVDCETLYARLCEHTFGSKLPNTNTVAVATQPMVCDALRCAALHASS